MCLSTPAVNLSTPTMCLSTPAMHLNTPAMCLSTPDIMDMRIWGYEDMRI